MQMRSKGFTLIEVMVSLAIVGTLLITLIYSLNLHIGVAGRHETETVGAMLAKWKLSTIANSPAEATGEFLEPFNDYGFKVTVNESPYSGIVEAKVTVSRDDVKVSMSKLVKGSK